MNHEQSLRDIQLQQTLLSRSNLKDEVIRLRSKLFVWRIYAVVGWGIAIVVTLLHR